LNFSDSIDLITSSHTNGWIGALSCMLDNYCFTHHLQKWVPLISSDMSHLLYLKQENMNDDTLLRMEITYTDPQRAPSGMLSGQGT
jgi:hypothetical protein